MTVTALSYATQTGSPATYAAGGAATYREQVRVGTTIWVGTAGHPAVWLRNDRIPSDRTLALNSQRGREDMSKEDSTGFFGTDIETTLRYDPANPEVLRSVVCFADIMGFSDMIKQQGGGNQLLVRLHKALKPEYAKFRSLTAISWILKAFTDNIVLGKPILDDGEREMGSTLLDLAAYQWNLVSEGFLVRGGIAVGDFYADADFAFGNALLEAHDLEANHAQYPRIILSDLAVDLVKHHMNYYTVDQADPYTRELVVDNDDGRWFVNYLFTTLGEEDEGYLDDAYPLLLTHKAAVESNLQKFAGNSRVYEKYMWLARYHNYFCNQLRYTCRKSESLQIAEADPGPGFSIPRRCIPWT